MSRTAVFLISCFLTAIAAGQEGVRDHSAEIYALASGGQSGIDTPNSSAGFRAGGAWRPHPRISLAADFGRLFSTDTHGAFNTIMAGPRLYSADHGGLSGFIELRVGAEQVNTSGQATSWTYVRGPGAGADIRLTDRLTWRAIELDALLIRRSDPAIPAIRYSSGFVFKLGH